MRIALHNCEFLFEDQSKNFHGYNYAFYNSYVDYIFVPSYLKALYLKIRMLRKGIKSKKFIIGLRRLNKHVDLLICFAGMPYHPSAEPIIGFNGKKIYHTTDFSNKPIESNSSLMRANVDWVMGHARIDENSDFFRMYYKEFIGKVISVPFGYGKRFICKKSFESRVNKAIALGSIYPVKNNPFIKNNELDEFKKFFADEEWSHPLRRKIVENREMWEQWIDSQLPVYPECRNEDYEAVEVLNEYTMYINCESLDNFPPARTYEAMACGCIMVAADKEIYKDLGFIDGVNCILFKEGDYENLIDRIKYYMNNYDELYKMHLNTLELAKEYSHEKVADRLFCRLVDIMEESHERTNKE